tara:strand:- start:9200 stop:10096 length:897 start_codon:yes stop_codon:yes gene_type:complete
MVNGRKRVLSDEGIKLFNICYEDEVKAGCIKNMLHKLFTSDFDIKLEKNSKQLRYSSCRMFALLHEILQHCLPVAVDNAITNLVLLILTDGTNQPNTICRIRYNIGYYYSLAKKAYEMGDHHSAIMIKCALLNTAITRLKLKRNKKWNRIDKLFEKEYGSFINCHSNHLEKILNTQVNDKFLPSIIVLHTHLKKSKEYAKNFERLGKCPKKFNNCKSQLENRAEEYYLKYRTFEKTLIDLYTQNPLDNKLLASMNASTVCGKLLDLSNKIDPRIVTVINPLHRQNKLKRTKRKFNKVK